MRKTIFRAKLKGSDEWIYWNMFGEITTESGKRHSYKKETSRGYSLYYTITQMRSFIVMNTVEQVSGAERTLPAKRYIDPSDDKFGTILNCAVRYACGRRTYMPKLVIDFITPLLPSLSSKALWCFDQDLTDAKHTTGYGDPNIDKPEWLVFHEKVRAERTKRGDELYKDWRENDG